jgi:MFS family permease
VEKNAVDPILSIALFKNRVFAVSNLIGFLMGLGMFGSLMFLPLFFQGVLGISATGSGNTMLPMMISMMGTSVIAGRLSTKAPFRFMYLTGMSFMALGFYLMSRMSVHTTQFTAVIYMIILGIGMGVIMPIITIAVQSAFGPEKRGVATSATQFFRSIGGTFGMTFLGILFNNYSRNVMRQDFFPVIQTLPGISQSPLAPILTKAQEDPHSLFNILLSPDMLRIIPADLQQLFLPPLQATLAESLHIVFWTAMVIAVAGVIISLLIGDARLESKPKREAMEEAGLLLYAEGIPEVELASELVPDLVDGTYGKREKDEVLE